ncbi:hypothetical protein [Chryseobacterium sp.]|uniref:hypothetical protein n=1 Tax=Chryseobacterium sp. TaxID=1871047 RepID=UPI0025C5C91B|nr:hypothetical protein [Chryseobacterium sp.]
MDQTLRKTIDQYTAPPNDKLLEEFRFIHNGKTDYYEINDLNYPKRKDLILELYKDYGPEHKSLVKWLLKEEQKGFEVSIPIYTIDLCAFMLYKHMDWEDIYDLYEAKFGTGTDAQVLLDIELVFGLDKERIKEYLQSATKNKKLNKKILKTIEYYESNSEARFKSRNEYIHFFENFKIKGLMGDLEECQ